MSINLLKRATATATALLLDRITGPLVGDGLEKLPDRLHPVAWFGRGMSTLETRIWRDDRAAGLLYTATGTAIGLVAGRLCGSTTIVVHLATAGHQLRRIALEIANHLESGDLDMARATLPSLAGRDPEHLDRTQVAAAVVESLAENSVDAVIAPAFWGLVAGAPGAAAHRAINTMDAMVGHRSSRYERFGWSAARLDDAVNWLPARLFALTVAASAPSRARDAVSTVLRDASDHPSPNAGVAESALAGALNLRLGGSLSYSGKIEDRPILGDGHYPDAKDIRRAVDLVRRCEAILVVTLGIAALAALVTSRHSDRAPR
ncbi:MAG: cobalamin biosynthesis protein CobD [Acidimicrobiaceae bacterium]|nr:cobalamin biosynthesis protein CobD [Acidimicrobiaceae bacterium]